MINKVILLGRLGQDPKVQDFNGTKKTSFSVATSEGYKDRSGQQQKKTEWHDVVVWGAQAGPCAQFLKKGSNVFVEGKIERRSYTDQSGQERRVFEIKAQSVKFLDKPSDSPNYAPAPAPAPGWSPPPPGQSLPQEEELPF